MPALLLSHLLTKAQLRQEAVRLIFSETRPAACVFLAVAYTCWEAGTSGRDTGQRGGSSDAPYHLSLKDCES